MSEVKARHGEVRDQVLEWLEEQTLGTEFHYADVAEELGRHKVTVSSVMNTIMRAPNPILGPGGRAGWFRIIRPVEQVRSVNGRFLPPAALQQEPGVVGSSMEVVGILKNDNRMLRAEDGSLWEASPR